MGVLHAMASDRGIADRRCRWHRLLFTELTQFFVSILMAH